MQIHPHSELIHPGMQHVGIDAAVAECIDHPAGPVLFHGPKLAGRRDCKYSLGPMVQRLGPLAGDPLAGDPLADDPLASAPPAFAEEAARQILHDGFGVTGSLTALAGERDQNFRSTPPPGSGSFSRSPTRRTPSQSWACRRPPCATSSGSTRACR